MKIKILILLCFITSALTHFIVFENIGQMASAVTYINVKITYNVVEMEDMMYKYKKYITRLYSDLQKMHLSKNLDSEGIILKLCKQTEDIVQAMVQDSNDLRDHFDIVRWLLPAPPARPERFIEMLGLGLGVMGTFLGIYNQAQISQIQNQLGTMERNQDKLIHSLVKTQTEIRLIEEGIKSIDRALHSLINLNPGLIAARLARMEKIIQRMVHKLTHTFQMAQTHRLAIDFLPADEINQIYKEIEAKAKQHKLMLITSKPLDLFQLEVSYFSDGHELHIIIHVPAVTPDSLLKLFKMHPLPLPLDNKVALVPKVDDNILGLTRGDNKLATHLSSLDLLDCKNINRVFLCERHGILDKHVNSSCMGALYLQNFDSAAKLCPLITKPLQETLHQLADNWFLIYSIMPQTAPIICNNGTESQFYLPQGISRNHLSPGCKATFSNHILLTDSSITLENHIQHFDWTWLNNLQRFDNISDHLIQMHDFGFTQPTLDEIEHFKSHDIVGVTNIWHKVTIYLSLTLAAILIILFLICCTNKLVFKRFIACMLFSSKYLPQDEPQEPNDIEMAENLFPSQPPHNPIVNERSIRNNF